MNKLVLLNEIRKEVTNGQNKLLELKKSNGESEECAESYITFKERFKCFYNDETCIDYNGKIISNAKYENKLNEIMERIFKLNNRLPLIGLINSIYNDELSIDTKIKYIKDKEIKINNKIIDLKNCNHSVNIVAEDDYKKFQYLIQFETMDDQNISVMITKIDLDNKCRNVISLNKKKKEYENHIMNLEKNSKYNFNKCLIMFNSNIAVPDIYEFKSSFGDENLYYKINIMKSWKYDFKQLFEKNMYMLFPMKVLDLKIRLLSISQGTISKDLIRDEIIRFFKDMNRYLMKVKDKNIISDKDINELNIITMDLINHFIKETSSIFIDIKTDIEATLKDIVV